MTSSTALHKTLVENGMPVDTCLTSNLFHTLPKPNHSRFELSLTKLSKVLSSWDVITYP